LGVILVFNELCCGVICLYTAWVSHSDVAICINLMNES